MSGGYNKLLICSAGLPGSGKGVIAKAAKKIGLPVIVMGDIVRKETLKEGLKPNIQNTAKIMIEYRIKYGMDIFAKLTFREVEKIDNKIIFIDGVRNPEELEFFRKKGCETIVIAVLASPKERFRRLRERKRVDDIRSYNDFVKRDEREIKIGLWRVLLYADKFFVNEGKTREQAIDEALQLLSELIEVEKEN